MKIYLVTCIFFGLIALSTAKAETVNPMAQIAKAFPKSIAYKNSGRLIEFCPDNTCDGFIATKSVSRSELKKFAFLWIYAFSDFAYLDEWRSQASGRKTAERILAEPSYRSCNHGDLRERMRCALLAMSKDGRIKLIFIRYDEGARNVVDLDIGKELSSNENPNQ